VASGRGDRAAPFLDAGERRKQQPGGVECQEWRRLSDVARRGGAATAANIADEEATPIDIFYCSACATREFGARSGG